MTEPRALAALLFPCQIRLSRLAPAAHFEQSEFHLALARWYAISCLVVLSTRVMIGVLDRRFGFD